MDAGFAKDWSRARRNGMWLKRVIARRSRRCLGEAGLVSIRRSCSVTTVWQSAAIRLSRTRWSQVTQTIYRLCDGPGALKNAEYAAVAVPKILDLPPFKPEVCRLVSESLARLEKVAA